MFAVYTVNSLGNEQRLTFDTWEQVDRYVAAYMQQAQDHKRHAEVYVWKAPDVNRAVKYVHLSTKKAVVAYRIMKPLSSVR